MTRATAGSALTVESLGGGHYRVRGGTTAHNVELPTGEPTRCDCPDHRYRKRDCKHIRAAVAWARRQATPARAPHPVVRSPALAQWRCELAAGERTVHTFDALWRAACAEAAAEEYDAASLPGLAAGERARARELVGGTLRKRAS